ncbi:extracellular solute-binding protein [Isoptericola halotolerans]|uniref:Multiple sugar transport system substrate-binding protein n=1 Tax=Isoptericola halotolerans TaxID=300560 RepID=A0ABX1ZZG2_9MICO|nr:extracellular solute-binding protein [Isoptericola halotolerans]NOV96010.1 multiple sugar transport system substrate-binding protein [Isoptericola halotolerans]
MRISRNAAGAVAATAALTLVLTACSGDDSNGSGGGEGGDVTLTVAWWGNDDRADKYEESIDLFEAANPNITVQTQFQAWDDYWTARNTEAAGQALPDVFQMDLSYLRQYGSTGQLADLSGSSIDTAGFEEALLEAGQIEGAQYGIPTSQNTLALFYNGDVLDEVGVEPLEEGYTWEDFNAFIAEVSEAGTDEEPAIYGSGDYTGTFWFFAQWLIQQGVQPFTEDGQLNFDESHATEFLNLASGLREAGQLFPTDRATQLAPLSGFTSNEVGAEASWDNFLAGYVSDAGTENIHMLPMPSGDNGPQQFWKPSMLLSSSASSEHPEEAAALISFLVNDPEVGEIFGTSKGVPAVAAQRDAMNIEEGSVDATVLEYEEAVAADVTETAPLPVEGFGSIEAEWMRLAEELGYGNITVDQFVEQWFMFAADAVGQS